MPRKVDPAPHGRDESGTPLAPYGYNTDGSPRKSNRGRKPAPGTRPATGAPSVRKSMTDTHRKSMLVDLADMLLVTPLAGISQAPRLVRRLGRHADALAGDAFILAQFMPGFADGLILLSKSKPAALSWLDKTEENAPFLLLAQVTLQAAKALAENHLSPNPRIAEAGRNLASLRIAQMAEAVNREAERIAQEAAVTEPTAEFEQYEQV